MVNHNTAPADAAHLNGLTGSIKKTSVMGKIFLKTTAGNGNSVILTKNLPLLWSFYSLGMLKKNLSVNNLRDSLMLSLIGHT